MLFISFFIIFLLIYSNFEQKSLLKNQKPFKINFYTSYSKQNIQLYKGINKYAFSNQDFINYYHKHNLITKVCVGTPKSCFNTELSFSSRYSWICSDESKDFKKNNYIYSKSSTFQKLNEEEKIMTGQGIKSSNYSRDVIKIYDTNLYNEFFEFFLVENCGKEEFGELSLGTDYYYNYNYTYLSFIEQLIAKKIIENQYISVIYKNNTFGEILLGVDYNIYKNKSNYYSIPSIKESLIISKDIKFIYYLKQVKNVNENSEEETVFEKKINIDFFNNLKIYLDFTSSLISMPEELFDNLIEVDFIKYIHNKKICEIKNDTNKCIKYLICDKKILNTNLEKLVISFNSEQNITISLDDMFLSLYNKNEILFGIISEKNINYIYLGEIFLKNHLILFDENKKGIRFYDKKILKNESPEKFNIIFIFIMGICILIIIYYLMSVTWENKNNTIPSYSYSNKYIERFLIKKTNSFKKNKHKYKRRKRYDE